jgi:uncharacterized protein YukE
MGTTQATRDSAETSTNLFSAYPPSETRFIEEMKKSVSRYRQSVENYQQDWIRASKNNFDLIESVQREFTEKSETNIAMIDAGTRIIKALNDNAKACAELNHTITQIWVPSWPPKSD